jgi:hypothetical protein
MSSEGSELMLDERPVETTLYSLHNDLPEMPERRSGERHLTLLRVGMLTIGDRRELCLNRNISEGGILIRPYCRIAAGERITIELKQGEPVSGTAKWAEKDCVGVAFDDAIDVLGLLSASAEGPRPRMPRVAIDCLAWVREDATIHRVRAVNISQGGVRIESEDPLPLGAEVIVSLAGLHPCPGTVRWSEDGAFGINFNRVLALPVLVSWLQEQRSRLRAAG